VLPMRTSVATFLEFFNAGFHLRVMRHDVADASGDVLQRLRQARNHVTDKVVAKGYRKEGCQACASDAAENLPAIRPSADAGWCQQHSKCQHKSSCRLPNGACTLPTTCLYTVASSRRAPSRQDISKCMLPHIGKKALKITQLGMALEHSTGPRISGCAKPIRTAV